MISSVHKCMFCIPGLLAFVVYMLTMPSTLQVGDAGEQIAAAHVLGISHPTGTPLYLLLMKFWELVFPFGTIVWRMNFLNALLGSISVVIFAALIYRVSLYYSVPPQRGLLLSITLSLTLAVSKTYWHESVAASSYLLHALFVVVWLSLLTEMIISREYRSINLLYLSTGMALANHVMSVVLVILAWCFSVSLVLRNEVSLKRLSYSQLYLLPGLSIYLYIPLRAAASPLLNWENPNSVKGFINYILRLDYRDTYVASFRDSIEVIVFHAKAFLGEMSLVLPMLAMLCLVWHGARWLGNKGKRARGDGLATRPSCQLIGAGIMLMVLNLLFLIIHGSHTDIFFWRRYMLTGYIGLFFSVAVFLVATYRFSDSKVLCFAILIVLCMPGVCLYSHFVENDRSKNTLVDTFVEQVFSHLPQGATLILHGDNYLFPILYYHLVEGKRPDLTLLNRKVGLGKTGTVSRRLIQEGKVYSSHNPEMKPPFTVVPAGLVLEVVDGMKCSLTERPWRGFDDDDIVQARSPLEKALLVDYYHRRSVYHAQRNECDERLIWVEKMEDIAEGYDQTLVSAGRAFATLGLDAKAARCFVAALAINEKSQAARDHLEKITSNN